MKRKILFACDLDNTLLHSHRNKAEGAICAEVLDGMEQSFFTPLAYELIKKITADDEIMLLPVTTRSEEQYKRIIWHKDCIPKYALVCNGSVLLKNGETEKEWYEQSDSLTASYRKELNRLYDKYSKYDCFKTVRIVDEMFLFVYCHNKDEIEDIAEKCRKDTELAVEYSGSKMYFFPPVSNKGYGVKRFVQRYSADYIVVAGDSSIDYSMLEIADTALVPDESICNKINNKNTFVCGNEPFSEFILKYVSNKNY